MEIFETFNQFSTIKGSTLTIGVFDGVHLGHRFLMQQLIRKSKESDTGSGVVTFSNHPATVVNPDFEPNFLTSLEDRIRLIKGTGVDFVIPLEFNETISSLGASDFLQILKDQLGMAGLVVGPDFCMGKNREADVSKLTALGSKLGFTLDVVEAQEKSGMSIRSTNLRKLLAKGEVGKVELMLGRPFSLSGEIVDGFKRGRQIGFPTANLTPEKGMALPKDGIYSTLVYFEGEQYMAATSVGTRPTFDNGGRTIEAYILDFDKHIYGKFLRIEFINRIRDEISFDTIRSLVSQINSDVNETRRTLEPFMRGKK